MEASLVCPRCACPRGRVLETREITIRGFFMLVRIRECGYCGKQFRTKEIADTEAKLPSQSRAKKPSQSSLPENPVTPELKPKRERKPYKRKKPARKARENFQPPASEEVTTIPINRAENPFLGNNLHTG